MQTDLSDQGELLQRLEQRRQDLMQQDKVTSIDGVPVEFQGISLQEGENHGNDVFDRHYGRLFDIYTAQTRAYQ